MVSQAIQLIKASTVSSFSLTSWFCSWMFCSFSSSDNLRSSSNSSNLIVYCSASSSVLHSTHSLSLFQPSSFYSQTTFSFLTFFLPLIIYSSSFNLAIFSYKLSLVQYFSFLCFLIVSIVYQSLQRFNFFLTSGSLSISNMSSSISFNC